MKKTYQKPDTCVIKMMHQASILAGSPVVDPQSKRRIGYEVSDLYNDAAASKALDGGSGKVVPFEVLEVSTFSGDPFGGHGQGTGGEGTRSNSSLWED